jgi:hypothetical protein
MVVNSVEEVAMAISIPAAREHALLVVEHGARGDEHELLRADQADRVLGKL